MVIGRAGKTVRVKEETLWEIARIHITKIQKNKGENYVIEERIEKANMEDTERMQ